MSGAVTPSLEAMSTARLLALSTEVKSELRRRDILRSENSPTGDWAEYLFCQAFGWEQMANSVKGYDARDADGQRFQIKGRRLHPRANSRQLSAMRNLDGQPFDWLAGVLFNADYTVSRAALVPYGIVTANVRRSAHTNSAMFYLRDGVWDLQGVHDVTDAVRRAAETS